eukprot:scaffold1427_cov182-Amphora_coffeaeformis.AAC.2
MGAQACKQSSNLDTPSSRNCKTGTLMYAPCDNDWPWVWAIRDYELLDGRKGCPTAERVPGVASLPVHIHDKLYLGNAACISDINHLKDLGITGVLNVAGPQALANKTIHALKRNDIEYHSIAAKDERDYPFLAEHWEKALVLIKSMTNALNSKLVVHCQAGFNRSGLLVTSYYMISTGTPVLEAVRYLRRQRGNLVLRNPGYQEQLVALARENGLLGTKPGTTGSILHDAKPPDNEPNWWVTSKRT